jgi:pimeloyl-ACP methyl ester carboxylesterase
VAREDLILNSKAQPKQHGLTTRGVDLACFEWNPESLGRGPTLLFAHGTGFHARCWDRVIERLEGRHAVAVDIRGHGRSQSIEIQDWRDLGEDLADWIDALELRSVFGIGHSMGGHAMVQAAAKAAERFCGLVLVDPVIGDPEGPEANADGESAEATLEEHPVAKRRNHFESPEEMIERFSGRIPYSRFDQRVLRDYCEYGLLESASGGFELACPPSVEASFYTMGRGTQDVFDDARRIEAPVLVVRAQLPDPNAEGYDMAWSPTWPGLVELFPNARDLHLPEATHFIPLEDPARIAEMIVEALDRLPGRPAASITGQPAGVCSKS